MVNIIKTLEKNKGIESTIKFFKSSDEMWYAIGNGGLGTTIVVKIGDSEFYYLNKELLNGNFVLFKEFYLHEIQKSGVIYYYKK